MTKIDIINKCLQYTGSGRTITSVDTSKPEQVKASDYVDSVTFETTATVNILNPSAITPFTVTNNFDSLALISNIEPILNFIRAKTVRNYVNTGGSDILTKVADKELLEATLQFAQFFINKGVPTKYLNQTIAQGIELGFDIDNTSEYVKKKSEYNFLIDIYNTIGIKTELLNELDVKKYEEDIQKLFLSLVDGLIQNNVPDSYKTSIINELESIGLGEFANTHPYVLESAKYYYKIDLYNKFGITALLQTIDYAGNAERLKRLFNSCIAAAIDAGAPESMLNEVIKELNAKGWYYNRIKNLKLSPNEFGIIPLPSNILRLDSRYGYIKKSGKLYDVVNNTFVFKGDVIVDCIFNTTLTEMPELFQTYVRIKSNMRFINLLSSKLGKDKYRELVQRYTDDDLKNAYSDISREEMKTSKSNIFNDYYTRRALNKFEVPTAIVNNN